MPELSRFTLHRRHPEAILILVTRAIPGDRRIDQLQDLELDDGTFVPIHRGYFSDLQDHGIIRGLRNKAGSRLMAHRITVLGLAWLQGRTPFPVPRKIGGTFQWWTPQLEDFDPDERGGYIAVHPEDAMAAVDAEPLTIQDDPAAASAPRHPK